MADEYDSDGVPEEITFDQGSKQDEELREVREKNKKRVSREQKERRKLWAKRKTPKPSKPKLEENIQADDAIEDDRTEPSVKISGMLPNDVLSFLATREKKVFSSDSEEEAGVEDDLPSKKRTKKNFSEVEIIQEIPPPPCAANSLAFLKKRKLQVQRSNAVLTNAGQALRLLSSNGFLFN